MVELNVKLTIGFWRQPDFDFQPKLNVCLMLELNVKPAIVFDVNQIFISKNSTSLQCWRNDVNSTLGFDDIRFSFPTKIQRLSNVGGWFQASVGFWRQLDFHFQLKFNVCPLESNIRCQLGYMHAFVCVCVSASVFGLCVLSFLSSGSAADTGHHSHPFPVSTVAPFTLHPFISLLMK